MVAAREGDLPSNMGIRMTRARSQAYATTVSAVLAFEQSFAATLSQAVLRVSESDPGV